MRVSRVTRVEGEDALAFSAVVVERLDAGGAPIAGSEVTLPLGGRVLIGASSRADLGLADDDLASGRHLELSADAHGVRARDLDSTNGTFRLSDLGDSAGERFTEGYIEDGALLRLGGSRIRVRIEGRPAPDDAALEVEHFGDALGHSPIMRRVFGLLAQIAGTDATVLLTGETGTGKEVLAREIHTHSPRKEGPMVVVDCGAIAEGLVESDLFGHEKGAFTGAVGRRQGAFETARGGTVFLDEIGELPLALQPRLLRVLDRREVKRVGGSDVVPVDVRVVAATHRDLGAEVRAGRFREDLYYRLCVVPVEVPPLRERSEDVGLLARAFATRFAQMGGKPAPELPGHFLQDLAAHDWPGNVRELRNVVERSLALGRFSSAIVGGGRLAPASPAAEEATGGLGDDAPALEALLEAPFTQAKDTLITWFERRYLSRLVQAHGGNISAAARAASMDRKHLRELLRRHDLDPRA